MLVNDTSSGGERAASTNACPPDGRPRRRGRPRQPRCVAGLPPVAVFKPAGVPARELHSIALGVDELEAMRLVDARGLSQEEAANAMGVSRQTVGRLLETGRRSTVRALTEGLAVEIGGGAFCLGPAADRTCPRGRAGAQHGRRPCCQRTEREKQTND